MSSAPSHASAEVLTDYMCAHGPLATHARGTLFVNAVANLRANGLFERYRARMPRDACERIVEVIATSWVPIQLLVLHYEACDQLGGSVAEVERAGELTAKRFTETFFGLSLRIARNYGVDAFPYAMSQVGRLYERLYQGGGCAVFRTGPKDMIVETYGLPHSNSRYFRAAYQQYFRVASALLCKSSFVQYARPRRAAPGTLSLVCSWV